MLKYYLPNLVISYIGVKITWNLFNIIYAVGYLMSFFLWWKKKEISPELAKLHVNCLKSIENLLKLFTFQEEAKESHIKVTESLKLMSAKFDNLIKEIKKKMNILFS